MSEPGPGPERKLLLATGTGQAMVCILAFGPDRYEVARQRLGDEPFAAWEACRRQELLASVSPN